MLAAKTSMFCRCYLALNFFLLIFHLNIEPSETRYIGGGHSPRLNKERRSVSGDDVDLEKFVEDYYDELWQYVGQIADAKSEKEAKKIKNEKVIEKDGQKPNFPDFDYMSDMGAVAADPSADCSTDEKESKNFSKEPAETRKKENLTSLNEIALNKSYGEGSLHDVIRANRESKTEEEFAQRSKEMRLKSIISQVLTFRGGKPKENETIPDLKHYNALREFYEKNIKRIKTEDWTASHTEKVQSFFPSCDVPRNTDEDVWSDPYAMNLLFDLNYPNPQEDSTIMIVSAKLRLYKLPQENYSEYNLEPTTQKAKPDNIMPGEDDRQIRVSVYWYTRSLRRHRAKKKLLDSQMLSIIRAKWAEFNIRAAVRTWKDSGKNFGLVVTVEDEDGIHLPADQFIQSMNCSKWTAADRPIPSIIMDKAHQYFVENLLEKQNDTSKEGKAEKSKLLAYPYEPLLYPIIDLRTREVPNAEVKNLALVNSAKIALESKFINLTRRGFSLSNNSITVFLKNINGGNGETDFGSIPLGKTDKPTNRKSADGKEVKVSYFQNVPIGSPATNQNRNVMSFVKKNQGTEVRRDVNEGSSGKQWRSDGGESETGKGEEEREMPRIRHSRRQWDVFQRLSSGSRLRADHNVTDHR